LPVLPVHGTRESLRKTTQTSAAWFSPTMLAKHKVRRGLRPSSPLHFSRQSSVVSTSANLQKQISKAASVLPFSSVKCEKFYVIAADYLTPKIFDYKELLSDRDSTLISSMRSNYHWQAE
jgi:hypothetical protein